MLPIKPETKTKIPADLTPQIAKRAYEPYEARDHQKDPAVQDWEQVEREIHTDQIKAELKPEAKEKP